MITQICHITFNDKTRTEVRGYDNADFSQQGVLAFVWADKSELLAYPLSNIYEIFCSVEEN